MADPLQLVMALRRTLGGISATVGFAWLGYADPSRTGTARHWYTMNTLVMAGGGLIAIGLPSIHFAQAEQAGFPGAIGIVLLMIGMMTAYLVVHGIETINFGLPRSAVPITFVAIPALAIGAITTSIVSLAAGAVPVVLPLAFLASFTAGALTLHPRLHHQANTWLPTGYTAVLAGWGLWLTSRLLA